MKPHTLTVRLLMATLSTVCLIAVATLFNGSIESQNEPSSPAQGITLNAPPFINVAYANNQQAIQGDSDFLKQEAGISAYTNVGNPINLVNVEPLFRGIEKQTDEYIVGSIIPPGYEELPEFEEVVDVHVYIQRDGWIIAYLLESQEASLIVDWVSYDAKQLSSTTLGYTVQNLLTALSSSSEISYYDFRYPDATNLMLIADVERHHNNSDSFTVKIPAGFTVYESSWSHAGYNLDNSQCLLNEAELSKLGSCYQCWALLHDKLDQTKIQENNEFKIYNYRYNNDNDSNSYCAIALIYREAQ